MKPINLIYDIFNAHLKHNETRNAQIVMEELGITYETAIPQSLAEQWVFINCKNVPKKLPSYLKEKTNNN